MTELSFAIGYKIIRIHPKLISQLFGRIIDMLKKHVFVITPGCSLGKAGLDQEAYVVVVRSSGIKGLDATLIRNVQHILVVTEVPGRV